MNCPVCEDTMRAWISMPLDAKKDEFTPFGEVVRCEGCGLGMSARMPRPDEVQDLYDLRDYYTHGESHMRPAAPGLVDRILVRLAWQMDQAQPLDVDVLAARLPPGGSVLDLGCGDGELLAAFHARGFVAVGVDPDPGSLDFVRGKGLTAHAGTAEFPPEELAGQRFDLVIMSHSLEHCLDPMRALASVRRLLSPSGAVYIEVPNSGCRHFETFRECSEMFDAPRHLWFFTSKALSLLADAEGFRVERWHFNGFTRLFSKTWRNWECEIYDRLNLRGLTRGATRHSRLRSLVLLARTAFASPERKYDSIGIVASLKNSPESAAVPSAPPPQPRKTSLKLAGVASSLAVAAAVVVALGGTGVEHATSRTIIDRTIETPVPGDSRPAALLPQAPGLVTHPAQMVARTVNALTPFAPAAALIPAAPFVMDVGLVDRQRAVDCLAAAAYYEAGNAASDQRAVAQVILNRLRHPAFPHTVCGVVFQGSERSTGCQFTFTCDGSLGRRRPSALHWRNAQYVAEEMLSGRVEPGVGLATHYHTDWVMPSWNREMDKIAAVKTHLFFKWRGGRGGAASFAAAHAGAEPRIARIGGLSVVHGTGLAPPVMTGLNAGLPSPGGQALLPVHAAPATLPGPARERLPDRSSAPDANEFLVTLAAGAAPDSFLQLAEQSCSGRNRCRFVGWTNPARRASQLPMPGSSVDAISFMYIREDGSSQGRARWNCAEFPRDDRGQCLKRGG